jgi:hypothetical protein
LVFLCFSHWKLAETGAFSGSFLRAFWDALPVTWRVVAVAGCSLLLAAASPGGIFEEFLKKKIEKKIEKIVSKFFGDTLSRIVIDHENDHHPPSSPAPSN